jgi:gas vesicle protein
MKTTSLIPLIGAGFVALAFTSCDSPEEQAREERLEQKADQLENTADNVRKQGERVADQKEDQADAIRKNSENTADAAEADAEAKRKAAEKAADELEDKADDVRDLK